MSDFWVQLVRIYGQNDHFGGLKVVTNDEFSKFPKSIEDGFGVVLGGFREDLGGFWVVL